MFRKHAAPEQKAEANEGEGGGGCGRVRAVTDRLTLQPPDPDITTSHLGAPGSNKPWPATVRPPTNREAMRGVSSVANQRRLCKHVADAPERMHLYRHTS